MREIFFFNSIDLRLNIGYKSTSAECTADAIAIMELQMIRLSPARTFQSSVLPTLMQELDMNDPLMLLMVAIQWWYIEEQLAKYFSNTGRSAKPIRLMAGLLILKYVDNLSDEELIRRWAQNPYYQLFCGFTRFTTNPPCNACQLTRFRQRIGEEGTQVIHTESVKIFGDRAKEGKAIEDTTVQEKNIKFPTDIGLLLDLHKNVMRIAKKEGIKLKQTFEKELTEHKRNIRFNKGKGNAAKAKKSRKRIKTITGRVFRDLLRKLPPEDAAKYRVLAEGKKLLAQEKNSKDKVYSLCEPDVKCICKGKAHKKWEFGSKASISVAMESGIILSNKNYTETIPHDSKTSADTVSGIAKTTGEQPKIVYGDRGYRGVKEVDGTQVKIPMPPKKSDTKDQMADARKAFRRRSSIEPIISHLKSDHRMKRNFLRGILGDEVNLALACAAFNFKKLMRLMKSDETFSPCMRR